MNQEEDKDNVLIELKIEDSNVMLGFAEDHDYVISVLTDVITTMLRQNQDEAYEIFAQALSNVFAQEDMAEYQNKFALLTWQKIRNRQNNIEKINDKMQTALAYILMNTEEQ